MPGSPQTRVPEPLPRQFLANLAATRGLGLLLDYDGTLAEIVADPSRAVPVPGVAGLIDQIARCDAQMLVAIVTGRRIDEVKKLLQVGPRVLFSGVHGLEFSDRDGNSEFIADALACAQELERVRRWLADHVPSNRGFRIEDKGAAIGLHYRSADPEQTRAMCAQFAEFVARDAPSLKLLPLKMLLEAMPQAAGKGLAVERFRQRVPRSFVTVYFGDDTTDEAAFAVLKNDDAGILVGPARESLARYRVAGPRAVVRELRSIAAVCEERPSARSG
jgi:trehalose 6-phosphate phosphatase